MSLTDVFLAEKNLVDFVDKNLGQEWERLKQDELETDIVCSHLFGGLLDYPTQISHDFCDITTAWDVYIAALTKEFVEQEPAKFSFGVFSKKHLENSKVAKMPFRGDELAANQFVNSVAMCCSKIMDHITRCTEECISSGRLENLYVVISNSVIIRNYLWILFEVLESDVPKPKLKMEYKKFCDLVEVVCEQMLLCQNNLLSTYLLHDENTPDWSSYTPYFEGEKGSPCIQSWAFFLRSFQRDMWRIMPPSLSQRILAIVVNDSLGLLTFRYANIKPSEQLLRLYTCDLINIITVAKDMIFYIGSDLPAVLGNIGSGVNKSLSSIHMKCHCLFSLLVIVASPLELIYKNFRRGLTSVGLMEKHLSTSCTQEAPWLVGLKTICGKLETNIMCEKELELYYHIKLLSSQPSPYWPLVYKILVMNNMKMTLFILMLFPKIRTPVSLEYLLEGNGFEKCNNAGCIHSDCHSLPQTIPNHLVSSCLLYIIGHTRKPSALLDLFRPIFPVIEDWKEMNKTEIWNRSTRQVWFQSLIDLILPSLKVCTQSLVLSIIEDNERLNESEVPIVEGKKHVEVGKKRSLLVSVDGEDASTMWVIELLNFVTEIISIVPLGFFILCEEIDNWIPPGIVPVRNMAVVHFIVTALYMLLHLGKGMINSTENLRSSSPAKRTVNESVIEESMLAAAERLCHLEDPIFDQAVHRLVTQIESMINQSRTTGISSEACSLNNYTVEWDQCQLMVDSLLQEEEGQLALKTTYWFLVSHSSVMLQLVTDKGSLIKGKEFKISPQISTFFRPVNIIHDFHYVNSQRTFDQALWKIDKLDWIQTTRNCKLGLKKNIISKLLEKRWEFSDSSSLTPTKKKMVDELRSLVSV